MRKWRRAFLECGDLSPLYFIGQPNSEFDRLRQVAYTYNSRFPHPVTLPRDKVSGIAPPAKIFIEFRTTGEIMSRLLRASVRAGLCILAILLLSAIPAVATTVIIPSDDEMIIGA